VNDLIKDAPGGSSSGASSSRADSSHRPPWSGYGPPRNLCQGLVSKFPSFTRAARAQRWRTCAQECQRTGIGTSRNAMTKQLFENAATAAGQ